ncbi:cell migration-inducing and hyaluronan-binding protein-like [Mercenaria mercenaria]|uniref:cell migration-inducing and hyaluronan-binding protein-like n=1 Tax=Mercenaria mercenaria TaxID=6596 RepID=UPI00234F7981|nr:cell migration-inducing and hyaluronan-binding protein-like [Mercenaria mercenaria]
MRHSVEILFYLALITASTRADCPHERQGIKSWSSAATWGADGIPKSGDSIIITDQIIMDVSPPPLYNVTIENGGSLTFSSDKILTLKAANIYIKKDGALEIGSEDCPYRGDLTVVLTGNRESHEFETHPKAILVSEGGTLEIHGAPRLSWTKITETLNPERGYDSGNIMFNHQWEDQYNSQNSGRSGIVAYTFGFNSNGLPVVKDFGVYDVKWHNENLTDHINRVSDGDILMMATQVQITLKDPSKQSTGAYDAYETLVYGEVTGNSILRSLQQDGSTWAFVYQKGNRDSYSEETNPFGTTSTARFFMSKDMIFTAQTVGGSQKLQQQDNFVISNRNGLFPLVETIDEVTTWQPGDRVVIASTDYEWQQAEERTIVFCPDCQKNQFRINEPVKFIHFGKVLHDAVDMRAEVGLVTRNVVIRGEMEDECPEYNGNCEDSKVRGLDTFGAHIKILRNYANVHIEYAELVNVGQQTDTGRYPIHFHMTFDKTAEATVPYLRGNSIHDTFARCITIHGSHGVQVMDNFCYNHMGHGYFLEDGGEMNNVFDGNLAMTTRTATGSLEPVDKFRPASFWFTSPLNRFKNNVAAGGEGTGIWVVFPDEPLPPSREYGLMEKFEAKKTMLQEFDNNVAHSQGHFGVMIGNREKDDRNVQCCNQWQPLEDPKNPDSNPINISLSKITGYKNRQTNIWIEGGYLDVSYVSVADSLNGIFVTNEGQQDKRAGRLSHTVVIGDSENLGEPSIEGFDRSLPQPWREELRVKPHSGITMWKGPTQYSDIWFDGFQSNDIYDIGAIAKKRDSPYFFSVTTPFKNIQYAFDDGEGQGNLAISGVRGVDTGWNSEKDGEQISGFTYYNTTPTGEEKLYIVKPDHFSAAADDCTVRPNWRLAICTTKYGNMRVQGDFEEMKSHGIFVRDDLPSAQLEFVLKTRTGPQVVLDGSRTYTFHTVGEMPGKIKFTADGIEG